jgi:hypothetical protein
MQDELFVLMCSDMKYQLRSSAALAFRSRKGLATAKNVVTNVATFEMTF